MSDWNKRIYSWDFAKLATINFPGWDKINDRVPPSILLPIKHNADKSSHSIAVEFDGISEGNFYYTTG